MRLRRLVATATTLVLAGAGLALATSPASAASAVQPGPLRYVALGDSYSAGSGIWPPDPKAPVVCLRTTSNYPHVIAAATGASLTDVTCGAAQTKDLGSPQYPGVPAQLAAVKADTQLVTLTIGGNDNNTFIGAILACGSAGLATLGYGSPCKDIYGSRFDRDIDAKTYPAVTKALADIRAKAPNARVAILGYPWIVPSQYVSGCFASMPIARGDIPYLRSLQAHLNAVIERAAGETGATFVDLASASDGHDACRASGTRWVEPVLFGTNTVPVHPNALGESAMAARAMAVLGL